jgi:NAD-dependent deacetylase
LKIVVFTGAGVSAESGILTFRAMSENATGKFLWNEYEIEDVCSPKAWVKNKELVNEFYNQRRAQLKEVEPNAAHLAITQLDDHFDVTVITQNVDDLHERAGSKNIVHLHGELRKVRDTVTNEVYDWSEDLNNELSVAGNELRPHIVWFGEDVPNYYLAESIVQEADLLLVVGTSLEVYPAAGLVNRVKDECRVVVNNLDKSEYVPEQYQVVGAAGTTVPKIVDEIIKRYG